jgi:hypothetical protein
MKVFAKVVMAGVLAAVPMAMPVRAAVAQSAEELTTLTVHEAWVKSGRNEDKFFDYVKQLAEMSESKRGVTLPDNEATGKRLGMLIKANGRRDPDQLLYAVVDSAVTTVAGTATTAKK